MSTRRAAVLLRRPAEFWLKFVQTRRRQERALATGRRGCMQLRETPRIELC